MGRWRPPPVKSSPHITRAGFNALQTELDDLWLKRRGVTQHLAAAAAEGDRSENAEYIYRKKELREIDRRIRYIQKRLPELRIVDSLPSSRQQIFFGAYVTLARISHHPSTAAADPLAVTEHTPSDRLDVVSTTPAPSSSPCAPPQRHLDSLVTKGGKKSGQEPETGGEKRYRIVGADEFDPDKKWISIDSPLAKALLSKSTGDEVIVTTPAGKTCYSIVDVSYQSSED